MACRVEFGVLNQDSPPPVRGGSGGGDVATEIDENTAAGLLVHQVRAPIGGNGFCSRAQIEQNARRKSDAAPVELDVGPVGRHRHRRESRRHRVDFGEVTVVAQRDHRRPDRRIDVTIGQPRCAERSGDQVREHRADRSAATVGTGQSPDLRIGPKARRRDLNGVKFGVDQLSGMGQHSVVSHQQMHLGAPAIPRALADGSRRRGYRRWHVGQCAWVFFER